MSAATTKGDDAAAAAAPVSVTDSTPTTSAPTSSFEHDLANFSSEVGVLMVPALEDNYMYVLFDKITKDAAVIDPVEAPKLAAVLKKLRLTPRMILTTHSHWDHAGGNSKFVELFPEVDVIGGRGDKAQAATKEVADGDVLVVGKHVHVSVLFTPCHTPGHVCFYVRGITAAAGTGGQTQAQEEQQQEGAGAGRAGAGAGAGAGACRGVVFTGDTMFVGGCGNFNSGTPLQMREAFEKLSKLPKDTLVCCGHEYTAANLAYATFVEPDNARLSEKVEWVTARRAKGLPTIPSTLEEEADTNPFLRAVLKVPSVTKHCGSADPTECILFVRKEKSQGEWKKAAM